MESIEIVSRKRLSEEKYADVLCYPRYNQEEAKKRIQELERLGVEAIEFVGDKIAFNMSVLGKGCVGIVVLAHTKTGRVALKIRRMDADRERMEHEAVMLSKANRIRIGPRLIDVSSDFMLMEFIDGLLLPKWLTTLKGRGTRQRIRKVLRGILEQCWKMDKAGLDHGELSRAPKHIIIDAADNPHIVDFETASTLRRKSNVTSICQYLFLGSQVAKTLRMKLGEISDEALVCALRHYKLKPTRQSFKGILDVCGLCQ